MEDVFKTDEFKAELEKVRAEAVGKRTFEVELGEPIKLNGVEVSTITLRRPRARDLKRMEKASELEALALLVAPNGANARELEDLDIPDMEVMGAVLEGFLAGRLART